METVTVSPSFQISIPPTIRESLRLQPGQQVQIIIYDNRIELIPVQLMQTIRGFLKGLDTTIEREEDRV